ncbi:MEDS domain-containing protein [Streptomyces sp. B21-102]|uniref:MEDS domain-containing protein n=1 Tax=Streptomyces sp. B21-102 TaxID=3039416 RepID=UPI003FA7A590
MLPLWHRKRRACCIGAQSARPIKLNPVHERLGRRVERAPDHGEGAGELLVRGADRLGEELARVTGEFQHGEDGGDVLGLVAQVCLGSLVAGYSGLRVSGEMGWILPDAAGVERLTEYEANIHALFAGSAVMVPEAACCRRGRGRGGGPVQTRDRHPSRGGARLRAQR